jgi:predicted methyltransferase MtxX (methanogen marker protein 4)
LQRSAMEFPQKPSAARKFNLGDIIDTHQDGNVIFRKHASGSFTALVDGEAQPARQLLMELRDRLGLPDKKNNTTRTLGAQVFRFFQKT